MAQQQTIHKFVLGNKELDGKTAEFLYDKGWYSITDIVGEERNVIYKSRNAQEAYMKWNVYIGRKKERSIPGNNRPEALRADTGAQPQQDRRGRKESSQPRETGGRKRSRNNKEYRRQQDEM